MIVCVCNGLRASTCREAAADGRCRGPGCIYRLNGAGTTLPNSRSKLMTRLLPAGRSWCQFASRRCGTPPAGTRSARPSPCSRPRAAGAGAAGRLALRQGEPHVGGIDPLRRQDAGPAGEVSFAKPATPSHEQRERRFGVQPVFQQGQPWMSSDPVPSAATTVEQKRLEGGHAKEHRPSTKYDAQLAGTVQCIPLATTAPPSHPSLLKMHLTS